MPFLSLLSHIWPSSVIGNAGSLLYESLLYHAAFPFPISETTLSRDALYAALSLITKHQNDVLDGSEFTQSRTSQDRRRVLFRSLAKPRQHSEKQEDHDAAETPDETTIDLLNILLITQPPSPDSPPINEKSFQPLLNSLPRTPYRLENLHILSSEFNELLQVILMFVPDQQFQISGRCARRKENLNGVTRSVMAAFLSEDDQNITWTRFEKVISSLMVLSFQYNACLNTLTD